MGQNSQTEEERSETARSRERIDRKEQRENAPEDGETIHRLEARTGWGTIHGSTGTATVASASGGPASGATPGIVKYDSGPEVQRLSEEYGIDFCKDGQAEKVQRLEKEVGSHEVRRWADEGMTVDTMGKPRDMEAFRERQEERPEAVPKDIERQNQASVQRNVYRKNVDSDCSTVGNAVEHLHDVGELRAKLEVSSPNDPAEKEAEQVAEAVMRMDDSQSESNNEYANDAIARHQTEDNTDGIWRSFSTFRSPNGGAVSEGAEQTVENSLQSGGKQLPEETRSYFEPRFGTDFSDVTVHTGPAADKAARSINAKAFTMGSDIAFAEGQYNPESSNGKRLLGHELTHVIQQRSNHSTKPNAVDRMGLGSSATDVEAESSDSSEASGLSTSLPSVYQDAIEEVINSLSEEEKEEMRRELTEDIGDDLGQLPLVRIVSLAINGGRSLSKILYVMGVIGSKATALASAVLGLMGLPLMVFSMARAWSIAMQGLDNAICAMAGTYGIMYYIRWEGGMPSPPPGVTGDSAVLWNAAVTKGEEFARDKILTEATPEEKVACATIYGMNNDSEIEAELNELWGEISSNIPSATRVINSMIPDTIEWPEPQEGFGAMPEIDPEGIHGGYGSLDWKPSWL